MVVKTIARKFNSATNKQIARLIEYIADPEKQREGEPDYWLTHNLRSPGYDTEGVFNEFIENKRFATKSPHRTAVFHEMIAFHKDDPVTPEAALDLAYEYIQRRCPDSLVFCNLHHDRRHTHAHFIISGNKFQSRYQSRITKKELHQIKVELEEIQKERYPEIIRSFVMDRDSALDFERTHITKPRRDYLNAGNKSRDKRVELEKRLSHEGGQKKSRTEEVRQAVLDCADRAAGEKEFETQLKADFGLEFYVRSGRPAVRDLNTGKCYRLGRSLDILDQVRARFDSWGRSETVPEPSMDELERIQERHQERTRSRNRKQERGRQIDFMEP